MINLSLKFAHLNQDWRKLIQSLRGLDMNFLNQTVLSQFELEFVLNCNKIYIFRI
jgi:hypothetical protein